MEKDEIEVMVIFGMNIDNDQHNIIRDVMLRFRDMPSKDVKITLLKKTEMYLMSSMRHQLLLGRMLVIELNRQNFYT